MARGSQGIARESPEGQDNDNVIESGQGQPFEHNSPDDLEVSGWRG